MCTWYSLLRPHSIYVRLVRITRKVAPDDMEVDGGDPDIEYPPTFNLQNELLQFKVSYIHGLRSEFNKSSQHSPADENPWYLIMDLAISRSSRDVQRFRTGPGYTASLLHTHRTDVARKLGTVKFSCLVGTKWASKTQKRKAVVFVGACLALNASISLKYGFIWLCQAL